MTLQPSRESPTTQYRCNMTEETLKAYRLTHGKFRCKDGKTHKKGDTVMLTESQAKNFANMLAKIDVPVTEAKLPPKAEAEDQPELALEESAEEGSENEPSPKETPKGNKAVGKPLPPKLGVKK